MNDRPRRVLFLCTHNSARSQMAEGLTNALLRGCWQACSAGTVATAVRPEAIRVLAELGIDISHHRSKSIAEFAGETFDLVVTVCDNARESCPFFPGKRVVHQSFFDPASVEGDEETRLAGFRRVRDELREWILQELS